MTRAIYLHTHHTTWQGIHGVARLVHSPSGATLGEVRKEPDGYWSGWDAIGRLVPGGSWCETMGRAIECVSEGPTGTGTPYAD
jgi:hypothetical protein